jgi:hypothetical protein
VYLFLYWSKIEAQVCACIETMCWTGVFISRKSEAGVWHSRHTAGTQSLGRRIYTSAMLLLLFTHLSMGTNCSLTLNAGIQEALRQQNMTYLSCTINA